MNPAAFDKLVIGKKLFNQDKLTEAVKIHIGMAKSYIHVPSKVPDPTMQRDRPYNAKGQTMVWHFVRTKKKPGDDLLSHPLERQYHRR